MARRVKNPAQMIQMSGIRKTFRDGLRAVEVLGDFTLHVKAGEFVSIMGPSGSGKTTFLNIAGLLDDFDTGEYRLAGIDVRTLSDDAQSRLRNQHIGFVFQSFNLIPDLDVWDNVEVPLRYRKMSSSERRRRIDEVLERVGLTSRSSYLPSQLSGGQQQRVAIARALVGKPDLILADEPTGNLDSLMARQVMDVLQQISEAGTTIVVVTHSQEIASRTQRKLHVLDGRVIDPWAERPSLSEAS
jgi:putative ABC transport system ATP-binding protein